MIILLAIVTFCSTLLGGLFALKNQDKMHRILGFTAGVILGVVAFDLLPEIHELVVKTGVDFRYPMIALVIGFLLFHILEKSTLVHHSHEGEYGEHGHPQVGVISALALSGHSFLDGVGIGLGFQVNPAVGVVVAIAVISHDFADGINTVSLMLLNKNKRSTTIKMLALDAIAPILGVASTLLFSLSDAQLVIYLGFFVGFLLYIGASDILPQAHAKHPSYLTIFYTVLGVVLMYVTTSLIG